MNLKVKHHMVGNLFQQTTLAVNIKKRTEKKYPNQQTLIFIAQFLLRSIFQVTISLLPSPSCYFFRKMFQN